MSAYLLAVEESTLARLTRLAEDTGASVGTVIERLLDRDPHDHEHRCPTCVRRAAVEHEPHPADVSLLDLLVT